MVYDLNGNRTGKTGERLGADGKRREMRTAYSYDLMNRLTEERRKDDGDIYSYDSAGNRIRKQHYYYDLVTGENSVRCLNESIMGNAVDAARRDIVDGESFRNNPDLEKQYNNFRSKYWRWRAKNL